VKVESLRGKDALVKEQGRELDKSIYQMAEENINEHHLQSP
jgi:hypothetical protein